MLSVYPVWSWHFLPARFRKAGSLAAALSLGLLQKWKEFYLPLFRQKKKEFQTSLEFVTLSTCSRLLLRFLTELGHRSDVTRKLKEVTEKHHFIIDLLIHITESFQCGRMTPIITCHKITDFGSNRSFLPSCMTNPLGKPTLTDG